MFTKKLKNTVIIAQWLLIGLLSIYVGEIRAQYLTPRGLRSLNYADSLNPSKIKLPSILVTSDSTKLDTLQASSDLKTTVNYSAQDSTIMDPAAQEVHLYGKAKVDYGAIKLEANYIKLNWTANEVFAKGTYDSTAKKIAGKPVFQDGTEKYNAEEIRYNFKSKKGFIKGVITQQGDGNIRGTTVKKDAEDNMYIRGSIYTTCNLAEPHFHISSRKIKVIPEKQVISGPFNLVIAKVPLPIGLPFGYFPIPKKKEIGTSGIIMPQYGEEPNGRGFYLRDGGYYFALSERFNLSVTGQIYFNGSWGLGASSTYSTRYRYNGNFNVRYNRNTSGDEAKRGSQYARNDFSLVWSHSPVQRGTSSFGASVNIGSNSFNQYNEFNTNRYIQNTAASSVQYSKQFGQFARMGVSARVNQRFPQNRNIVDSLGRPKDPGTIDAGIDFNFGINQIAPFALKGGTGAWYESFRFGLDFSGSYSANNTIAYTDTASASRGLGFKLVFADTTKLTIVKAGEPTTYRVTFDNLAEFMKSGNFTGRYSIPIGLPNFKLFRYLNLSPSIALSGETFTQRFKYDYIGNNQVSVSTENGFFPSYTTSFGLSMNTRIYGTVFIKGKRLEAIRHTLIPNISYSLVPNQSSLYQEIKVNERGDVRYLNKYRTPGGSLTTVGSSASSISWSLNNLFEAKIRPKSDSSGKQFEKISLLDNLSINGYYNLAAPDTLPKMSDITMAANARLFKKIDFAVSASFDPYLYVADELYGTVGRKTNQFAIQNKAGLARLSNANITFNTRFAPKGADKPKKSNIPNTEFQQSLINANPQMYVDFNIPWTVNLGYNLGYIRQGLASSTIIQTVRVNGDFSLTPKWKFTYDTGLDITRKAPSITNISIIRDLHCWEMAFNWTPFAGSGFRANNYSFEIRAKSALLRDLKLSRRRTFYDQGGFR